MRPIRLAAAAAALAVLAGAASGCASVKIDGAHIANPALPRDDARTQLTAYTQKAALAASTRNAEAEAQLDAQPLATLTTLSLKIAQYLDPSDNNPTKPWRLDDVKYFIPKIAGYPRWFVAYGSYSTTKDQLLYVFRQDKPDGPWLTWYETYLFGGNKLPAIALDSAGWAEAVAPDASGLAFSPGKAGQEYVEYLDAKPGDAAAKLFADGPETSSVQQTRQHPGAGAGYTDSDISASIPALRLADGGVLAFTATNEVFSLAFTLKRGDSLNLPPQVTYFLRAQPKHTVTDTNMVDHAIVIPPTGAATVIGRLYGLVAAGGS